jgi:type IV pilus assembly protein PilF
MKLHPALALALLALAGCATPHAPQVGSPETRSARDESPSARIHTELAAGYFARGQFAIALQEVAVAQEADARYAPSFNVLGLIRGELREDKAAEDAFQRSLELSPNYSEAHNNYGLFLCQRGRLKEALVRFESALANPLYATPEKALANAGACALEKGDLAQSEVYFTRAVKRAPGFVSAQIGMADVHYRSGRWLAARNLLRQAGAVTELSAQGLWVGLRAERRLGDTAAEETYATQLRRRFPDALQTQWLITGQYDQPGSLL